jgi:hypothetical protein
MRVRQNVVQSIAACLEVTENRFESLLQPRSAHGLIIWCYVALLTVTPLTSKTKGRTSYDVFHFWRFL